ncbi:ig-like domain-containing protein [Microbacterium dauci]|uniref:Endonuclease/exonuclease/phosphatase family protein n=1 Tax=Microbacterium dauci TaxID=3048008 RepID=A0ABT6ZE85_9MICO|nr:endonuclease/exonuclease/phosphatase family protein [Microbacterium sp. LX3-4]MDJ1114476.1 endonuclease/exonuclease/phosphatase family protein [Microbacterium sp. LX3-4]
MNTPARLLTISAALAVALSTPVIPAAASDPPVLRVMQWNIQGAVGVDGDGRPDIERIAAVIAAEAPDIVSLNEVQQDPTDAAPYSGDQPAAFAAALTDDGYLYSSWGLAEVDLPRGEGSTTGQLILSKHPIVGETDVLKLPNENYEPGGKDRRSLLSTVIDVPGIGHVNMHATHLSTPGSAALVEDQKVQVGMVLDRIDPTAPTILAGDFNIRVTDVETQAFSQNNLMQSWIADRGMTDTWRQVRDGQDGVSMTASYGSTVGQNPDRRIDYVYASRSFEAIGGHMSTVDLQASDHVGVVMDLAFMSPENRTRTVLAGDDALAGWGQLTTTRPAHVSLSVCKNTGTAVDDGTSVRAIVRNAGGATMRTLADEGTTRGSCETASWRGRLPAGTELEVQTLSAEGVILSSRTQQF